MKTLTEKELVNLVKSERKKLYIGESVELAKKTVPFPDLVCKTEEPITKAARIARVAYLCGFHNGLITCSEYINRHDNAHAKMQSCDP